MLCSLLIRYNLLICCLVLAALVTCVALDQCGWYLVSGSQDCTCVIWDISHLSSAPIKPVQTLYGHDQPITTVAIATELDMVASGSKVNTHFILCPFNALRIAGDEQPWCAAPRGRSCLLQQVFTMQNITEFWRLLAIVCHHYVFKDNLFT